MGAIGRMAGVLFSPRAAFEEIVRDPGWVAPVILYTLFSLAIVAIFSQRVGWEKFTAQKIAQSPRAAERMAQLSAEQREQAIERSARISKMIGYALGLVGNLALVVVLAGLLLGAFNLLASAELDYKTSLGVTAHAWMPRAISGALGILILYLKEPDAIDLENLVASNAGAFLSSESPRWLVSLASSIDLFSFWTLFLLATGFTVASRKKAGMTKALAILFGLWAVWVLGKVSLAAAFS
jgi:hypothetical protein